MLSISTLECSMNEYFEHYFLKLTKITLRVGFEVSDVQQQHSAATTASLFMNSI